VAWRVHEARRQLRVTMEKLTREPTPLPRPRSIGVAAELREFIARLTLDSSFPDPITG
jgi:hypothetical protein